jgi:GNAT superfamily N-acetyltransferase
MDHLDQLVDVLVESHLDYAWERWALPVADRRQRLTELYRTDLVELALPAGEVWMTDCGSSVAVWIPRVAFGRLGVEQQQRLESAAQQAFRDRMAIVEQVDAEVAAGRSQADWFLATMGTLPDAQGRGLGSAVLGPRLAALDEHGETATLDTSAEANLRFYGRLGFEVVASFERLPHGAPTTWSMLRPASP